MSQSHWDSVVGCSCPLLRVQIVQVAGSSSCRVFVPKYTARMWFELRSCMTSERRACTVRVVLGSITLPQSFQRIITCTGNVNCSVSLDSLPWEKWLQIMVESLGTANASVSLEMLASFTGELPFSLATGGEIRENFVSAAMFLVPLCE